MTSSARTVLILSLAVSLAACAVGPQYERPDVATGEGWIAPPPTPGAEGPALMDRVRGSAALELEEGSRLPDLQLELQATES